MPEPYEEAVKITKAEAVRRAIAAGVEGSGEGVKWIKRELGMEVEPRYFAIIRVREEQKKLRRGS